MNMKYIDGNTIQITNLIVVYITYSMVFVSQLIYSYIIIIFWTHDDILGKGTHDRINIKRKHRVAGNEKLKKHNLITNLQMCIQTNAFTVNCWVGISRDTSGLKSCTLWKLITRQKKYNAGKETNVNF